MMKRNVLVGLFVIAGLTLFTTVLFLIGNRHEVFAHHIEYYAEFTDLSGLTKGAKVQVAGMDAGQVLGVSVPNSPAGRFRLHLRIDDTLRGLVRTDSVATIGTAGVVGETFLLIHPGSNTAPAARAQATLPSKEPTQISDLMDQGKVVLSDVDGTLRNVDGLLGSVGGSLNATLATARTTAGNVNDVVLGIKAGRGPAGMLLRDDALEGQIRNAVGNVQQTTGNLNHASLQADSILADIQSRQLPQKVNETLESVKSAASNIDASSRQLRQTISDATAPDLLGVTAGANIRESLANANAVTSNMADETEALKHNLFLRGFFRRRGYYNLAEISPAKYRNDHMFTSTTPVRSWVTSDDLFVQDSSGTEQLTTEGKRLLDVDVSKYGDAIIESPIVIEGYWNGVNAADQLVHSRSRAVLVRGYLQNRFQIPASHIGIVAMKALPPKGLDRTTWDGVCIVVLHRR